MEFKEKYVCETETTEKDTRITISDEAFAQCEILEELIKALERLRAAVVK